MKKTQKNTNYFIKRALALAKKGVGYTSPNPPVGAVIVKKGKVVGQGYHEKAGKDHAEVTAIFSAMDKVKSLKECKLYITLEPCCITSKTPPCTDLILASGIKKVYVGIKDPNPKVNGKGIKKLKNAKIKVEYGFLEDEINKMMRAFTKIMKTRIPFVTMKGAMSLDGKIALKDGTSKWITSLDSRKYAHKLRAEADGILVGINTVLQDDPHLGVRHVEGKDPVRIVIDPRLRIPIKSKILRNNNAIIVTTDLASKRKIITLEKKGIKILKFKSSKINETNMLKKIGKLGINHILIEGGATINTYFLEKKLIDELYLFIAPKLIGGKDSLGVTNGKNPFNGIKGISLTNMEIIKSGKDILIKSNLK